MPSSGCKKCALRSEEHTSELQSHDNLVCRLLLGKKRAADGGGRRRPPDPPPPSPAAPALTRHSPRGPGAPRRAPPTARGPADQLDLFFFNYPAPPETRLFSPTRLLRI